MKKIISIWLALLMLAAVVFMCIACGDEKDPPATDAPGTSANVTDAPETTSSETENVITESDSTTASETETTASTSESASDSSDTVPTPPATVPPLTGPDDTKPLEELYPKNENYADLDYGGKVFKIVYTWAPSTMKPSGYGGSYDIFENEANPDEAITVAAALRVTLISTYYNCSIVGVPAVEPMTVCNTAIDTNSSEYDLVLGSGTVSSYITNNRYYNILNLIDSSKDYWDQQMIRDLAVGGKLYAITGDMSIADDGGFWVMFFNKDILAENNLESPYELVKNKKWTIDKLMQMAADAAKDLDGDDIISNANGKDIFGFITHGDHARSAWIGCGLRLASSVNADGHYTIAAKDNTRGADIYQKVLDLMWAGTTGYANKQQNMGVPEGLRSVFIQQRSLFYAETLGNIGEPCGEVIGVGLGLKDYEGLNFGVVPQPMYDEDQGQYYSFARTALFYGVPSTADIGVASSFIDLWAYHGQQTIQKTYINQVAYAYTSDAEVADMIDIIIHSAVWDAGFFYDQASLDSPLISDVGVNKNRYASRLKSGADKLFNALEKIYNDTASYTH